MPPQYTNLCDLKTLCYWLDLKYFNQSEWRSVNYSIRICRAFTQNWTGSWGLHSLHTNIYLYYINILAKIIEETHIEGG